LLLLAYKHRGGGVKKILRFNALVIAIILAVGIIIINPQTHALILGNNSLINYDTSGTTVAGTGNQIARVSEDGKIVAWTSQSTNIIPGTPSTLKPVIYQRNIATGVVKHVSLNDTGTPATALDSNFAMSRTGRYIVFQSARNDVVSSPAVTSSSPTYHLYLVDTQLNTTKLVDQSAMGTVANYTSESTEGLNVSDDGRFVLFRSAANNLLSSGNPTTTNVWNYYVKDMETGAVINPTVSTSGSRANGSIAGAVSNCDGSIIAFNSNSTNLTPQDTGKWNSYIVDIRNGYSIKNLGYTANSDSTALSLSCNGRYMVLNSTATNLTTDIVSGVNSHFFRYDRLTASYELVDKSTSGYISSTQAPKSNTWWSSTLVSDDGKVVFFDKDVNLISPVATKNDKELYVRNPEAGTTELVPINSSGVEQNATSLNISQTVEINAQGTIVLYNTTASNLVPGFTAGDFKLVLSKLVP